RGFQKRPHLVNGTAGGAAKRRDRRLMPLSQAASKESAGCTRGEISSCSRLASNTVSNFINHCRRIVHFDDKFIETIIMKFDDDGIRGIMNVPEHTPVMLIERTCRNQTWKIGTRDFQSMPPT